MSEARTTIDHDEIRRRVEARDGRFGKLVPRERASR